MNKRLLALLLATPIAAFAQSAGSDEPPPAEMPSNLTFETDIYFVEPKLTLSFGARGLSGSKSSFSGTGYLQSSQDILGPAGTLRTYHDGTVGVDTRVSIIDNGDGTSTSVPITPDGKTNTWSLTNASQLGLDDAVAFHTYRADIQDNGPKSKDSGTAYGVEVAVTRDMGKILRFDWKVVGGLSINDINSKLTSTAKATITTVTDLYSLNGQAAPTVSDTGSYSSPPSGTTTTVTNADGTTSTVAIDTTTYLPTDPYDHSTSVSTSTTNVMNHFKLKGAYFTFRAGPSLIWPITQKFRLNVSAGAALVYAGTTYTVTQDFLPETGPEITLTEQHTNTKLLPGYYADASMEYWMTERAGIYLGAIYQNNGDYDQSVTTTQSNYTSKVDLTSLTGFKMGMNVRF